MTTATVVPGPGLRTFFAFEGACACYNSPEASTTVPGPVREELRRTEAEVQTLATYWTGTATARRVAAVAGGLPLIITVVVLGVSVTAVVLFRRFQACPARPT